ncbi:MAG TPA: glycosyltransferase [Thermoanaerobaculia bacterium]
MSAGKLLLFGNVSQPPYCNNLFPPVRAFQKIFRTTVVEPQRFAGFVTTGGARPTLIPDNAVIENTDPSPDVVVCLGGALHFSKRALRIFAKETVLAGFALSDPYGLPASLMIAPQFDLFYTQDWQTVTDYAALDIRVRRCDPATDPELYRPMRLEPDCDILYYGKWTPQRNDLVAALSARFRVRVHAYAGEKRWSVPVLPQVDTPETLCAAINRSRLVLETALLDDAEGKYRGALHVTPRVFFAASCGVPCLIESFPGLEKFFDPGAEVVAATSKEDLLEQAGRLLADEASRSAMGRRARQRALRDHTWDRRVESFLLDLRQWRSQPHPRPTR